MGTLPFSLPSTFIRSTGRSVSDGAAPTVCSEIDQSRSAHAYTEDRSKGRISFVQVAFQNCMAEFLSVFLLLTSAPYHRCEASRK